MALKNLTKDDVVVLQCVSSSGNMMLRLQRIEPRLKHEVSVVLAALNNIEERLRDLHPRINSHFMDVKARLKEEGK